MLDSVLLKPDCVSADVMLQMGFSLEEIQDSLVNQKYNDVMAAYLLLDYRNSEVRCFFLTPTHLHAVPCQLLLVFQSSLTWSYTDVKLNSLCLKASKCLSPQNIHFLLSLKVLQ